MRTPSTRRRCDGDYRQAESGAGHGRNLTPVVGEVAAAGTRKERKQRTRQALLDAALRLLTSGSLAALSLREVTREVGVVPTAFYRHFASMGELGVALVEESMRSLRTTLREARSKPLDDAIRGSVATLVEQVRAHEAHFRFLVRERHGGVPEVRRAIAGELRLFGSELAADLARFPGMDRWSVRDLRMGADLMVGAMLAVVSALLEAPDADERAEVVAVAERQLRLIALGMAHWRSRPAQG